jgi:hypothetical protein
MRRAILIVIITATAILIIANDFQNTKSSFPGEFTNFRAIRGVAISINSWLSRRLPKTEVSCRAKSALVTINTQSCCVKVSK